MERKEIAGDGSAAVLTDDKHLARTKAEVSDIERLAADTRVTTEDEHATATAILARIARTTKGIDEQRRFFTDPLNAQVKAINNKFKALAAPLERADSDIREKVKGFLRRREEERQAEERRRQQEWDKQKRDARALGGTAPAAPRDMAVPEAPKTTHTEEGSSTAAKKWFFEVVDPAKVPLRYLAVDERLVRDDVARGARDIPGVRIWQDFDLRVRA